MIGLPETLIIGGVLVLVFGATQIPKIARSLGEGLKEFKKSVKEAKELDDEQPEDKLESKDKTDIFFGSTLIDNLLPGEYKIEIRREGYHNWEKTLTIEKRKVTEAKNIILIPENPIFNLLAENVKELFDLLQNEAKVIS